MSVEILLGLLLKYGPEVYAAARKLFASGNPTEQDWAALDAILDKKASSYFVTPGLSNTTGVAIGTGEVYVGGTATSTRTGG